LILNNMLVVSCPPTCLTQFTRTDNKVFGISAVKPKVKGPRVYHEIKAVLFYIKCAIIRDISCFKGNSKFTRGRI